MSITETLTTEQERHAPADGSVRFTYATRTLVFARIAAGVLVLPFVATLLMRSTGTTALGALLLAVPGAWALLHAQRRIPQRPASITLTADGMSFDGSADALRWSDVMRMEHSPLRASVRFVTRRGRPHTIDADLIGYSAFLAAAARSIDAVRRSEAESRADGAGIDHAARPDGLTASATAARDASTAGDTLFHRQLHVDIALLSASLAGVILGLAVHPAFLIITALALPLLVWHWLMTPRSVAVDDTAVWVIRPLRREAIPLRAIRDVRFGITGRTLRPTVIIDHRDRGLIMIAALDAGALPLFDAIAAARVRAQAAIRTGPPVTRRGSAIRRADSRDRALLRAAAAAAALLVIAWITVLTGVPLRTATRMGNGFIAGTALLLRSPLETAGSDGMTALHLAADGNHAAIARALLDRSADTDARSAAGALTPLHIAAARGHADVVALLIEAGADVNATAADGGAPLAHTAGAGAAGDTAVAGMLLDAGADAAAADVEGRTALHHAAMNGHAPFIRRVARTGAAIESADRAGQRALHAAVAAGRQAAAEALIAAGADTDARGSGGRTPIAAAAAAGAPVPLVSLLLDAGAGAGIADDEGWNAVQLATRANNIAILELFARQRAPLNATDGRVAPALWLAADAGRTEAARALLRGGASPYARWDGRTAIDVARRNRNATLVALMQMR